MDYIKAFLVGGIICVIGQVLIDKTKLTSARILVLFVVLVLYYVFIIFLAVTISVLCFGILQSYYMVLSVLFKSIKSLL